MMRMERKCFQQRTKSEVMMEMKMKEAVMLCVCAECV